jgi:hypothetical protein
MVLTKTEQRRIDNMDRLARRFPKALRLYTTDGEIGICKAGIPSQVFLHIVPRRMQVNGGAMLTNMYDRMDNGQA